MNRFVATVTAAAVAATTLAATVDTASAGHRGDIAAAAGLGILGGLIVGGVIANAAPAPRVYAPANAHVAWCARKYRSYSAYDNTWIDKYGRVRVCASPYGY